MGYNTGKRGQILAFLAANTDSAFTLEEICKSILPDGKGKSTVYRLVSELVKEGRVRRLSDGRTRHCSYQFTGDDECREHFHLLCRDCGRMLHLDSAISHSVLDSILMAGFSPEPGAVIRGRCSGCTRNKSSEEGCI
jgi:Fur family ferric uptake transcriptional regulator